MNKSARVCSTSFSVVLTLLFADVCNGSAQRPCEACVTNAYIFQWRQVEQERFTGIIP